MPGIEFNCPHCAQQLSAPDEMAGQIINCPTCNKPLEIPGRVVASAPSPRPSFPSQPFPSFVTPLAGETLMSVVRPSWLYFLGSCIFGVLCLLVGIILCNVGAKAESPLATIGFLVTVVAVLYMLRTTIKMLIYIYSRQYVLTNLRVISKKGLISISMSEVRISNIRGANLRQGILDRILNVGSIEIGTAATAGMEILISGIQNPRSFLSAINSQRGA